jgi:hypothetical protein
MERGIDFTEEISKGQVQRAMVQTLIARCFKRKYVGSNAFITGLLETWQFTFFWLV